MVRQPFPTTKKETSPIMPNDDKPLTLYDFVSEDAIKGIYEAAKKLRQSVHSDGYSGGHVEVFAHDDGSLDFRPDRSYPMMRLIPTGHDAGMRIRYDVNSAYPHTTNTPKEN